MPELNSDTEDHVRKLVCKRFLKRYGIAKRGSVDLTYETLNTYMHHALKDVNDMEETLTAHIAAYFYGKEREVPSDANARVEAIVDEAVIVSRFYGIVEKVKGFINAGDIEKLVELRNEIISMIKASMPSGTD